MNSFSQYIGIDYSGAKAPNESLKNLRIYSAINKESPKENSPPPSPKKYWSRKGICDWLIKELKKEGPAIVGIDHGFSFPIKYFERYGLTQDWEVFLEDFHKHWPTDQDHMYVDFIRDGLHGNGKGRHGERTWRRLTEIRARATKGVFFFDVQGQVAKSTHAGLPWLLHIRKALGRSVHFWPFDGWTTKPGVHVIAEVYPSLWRGRYPTDNRNLDQQDAYAVCRWLKETDRNGELPLYFDPLIEASQRPVAEIEGWILGVL